MKHSQITDDLQGQASLYALGAMPVGEASEYVRHLEDEDCAVCRKAVTELQSVMSLVVSTLPVHDPSPALKARLLEQAQGTRHARTPFSPAKRRWIDWAAGVTAAAVLVLLAAVMSDNAELRRLRDVLTARISELQAQNDEQRLLVATLSSSDVRVVNLAGQGSTPAATGRIFWNQAKGRWLFYVYSLPPAPDERSFQLWFVPAGGNPVSVSVFNTQPDGSAALDIPVPGNLSDLMAAAVTTEPAGGVPQPTGPFALLGSLD